MSSLDSRADLSSNHELFDEEITLSLQPLLSTSKVPHRHHSELLLLMTCNMQSFIICIDDFIACSISDYTYRNSWPKNGNCDYLFTSNPYFEEHKMKIFPKVGLQKRAVWQTFRNSLVRYIKLGISKNIPLTYYYGAPKGMWWWWNKN